MATDKTTKSDKKIDASPSGKTIQTVGQSAMVEHDYGEDAGHGYEGQTSADTTIPFLVLLQALSPQITKETVPDAKPGYFFNTANEQLWKRDVGLLFVPAFTQRKFGRWVPRDQGGGFRGNLEPEDPVVLRAIELAEKSRGKTAPNGKEWKFGMYFDPDGLSLVECFYVYGVICEEASAEAQSMVVMGFKSTAIKPYKKWQTKIQQLRTRGPRGPQRPPLYAHLTRLTSTMEKNNQGEYYVPKLSPADPRGLVPSLLSQDDERFLMARGCYELVTSGAAKVDYEKQGAAGDAGAGEDAPF